MKYAIETHPLDIPQRLREIDPELRVVYDSEQDCYEVWGVDASNTPYILGKWKSLDYRVIVAIMQAYYIARSTGRPYKHMLLEQKRHNERLEEQRRKELAEMGRAMREDMRFLFQKLWPGWRAA